MHAIHRFATALLILTLAVGLTACTDEQGAGESTFFEPTGWGTYEFDGRPLLVAPQRLLFGDIEQGDEVQRVVELRNDGDEILQIDDLTLNHDAFQLAFLDGASAKPEELLPGQTARVAIDFVAPDDEAKIAELHIDSNDPDHPRWIVKLYANAKLPCLELEPAEELDFGAKDAGATYRRDVIARNCSPNAVTTFSVDDVRGDGAFEISEPFQDIALQIGEEVRIPVLFTPEEHGAHEAFLEVSSDDEFEPERTVRLVGRGNAGPCPRAIIDAIAPQRTPATADPVASFEAVPLDRITLRGGESFDPEGGTIARYEWTLVSRPTDSAAFLERPSGEADNELWLDLAGDYVVELDVIDSEGEAACEPARLTLHAVSDEDIHVQLVWDTPNDSNQNDAFGTDVDLHLLHPNGHWNDAPWDCFWSNKVPDWGMPRGFGANDGYADDPSLDIDDIDGWGPENINLDNPESGIDYEVGVHYYSDDGMGISYATVRIYIGGTLFAEYPRQRLSHNQVWHVATIEWPGGLVRAHGQVYDYFP